MSRLGTPRTCRARDSLTLTLSHRVSSLWHSYNEIRNVFNKGDLSGARKLLLGAIDLLGLEKATPGEDLTKNIFNGVLSVEAHAPEVGDARLPSTPADPTTLAAFKAGVQAWCKTPIYGQMPGALKMCTGLSQVASEL